jgi:peptide deformylase
MKMTMEKFGGIGLSANQCGVIARIFIIGYENFSMVCINPKVIAQSDEMQKADEGCLSFPALYCKIERPKWVDVEYTNELGETVQTRLEGLTARCYLHELDHMNGIKFTSHVGPVALQMAKIKQQKRIKTAIRKKK